MTKDAILCGDELRRRREASGLALRELAWMTALAVGVLWIVRRHVVPERGYAAEPAPGD